MRAIRRVGEQEYRATTNREVIRIEVRITGDDSGHWTDWWATSYTFEFPDDVEKARKKLASLRTGAERYTWRLLPW